MGMHFPGGISLMNASGSSRLRKRLVLNFLSGGSLDPRITFTRASSGTRVNSSGLIETVTTNVARIDYDPVTLACKGLLIEEARTNLLLRSQEFDNAAWLKLGTAGGAVTVNAAAAPDGTVTADKFTVGTGAGYWCIANYAGPSLTSGTAYTFSFYVKAAGLGFIFVRAHNNSLNFGQSGFILNLTTGAITYPASPASPATTGNVTGAGDGWWHVTGTSTANATVAPAGGPGIWPCDSATFSDTTGVLPANFTGDGTSGVYLWGAQFEAGAFATSYIPTTTATATRAADVASIIGTNFSDWFNASEGTFVVEFDVGGVDTSTRRTLIGGPDTGNQRLALRALDNTINYPAAAIGTGSSVVTLNGSVLTANTPTKVAMAYGSNMALSQSGAAPATSASAASVSASSVYLGCGATLAQQINGHLRRITYYPARLSNALLVSLTT